MSPQQERIAKKLSWSGNKMGVTRFRCLLMFSQLDIRSLHSDSPDFIPISRLLELLLCLRHYNSSTKFCQSRGLCFLFAFHLQLQFDPQEVPQLLPHACCSVWLDGLLFAKAIRAIHSSLCVFSCFDNLS